MEYPAGATGDVFRRLQARGFDFGREHIVDFYAVFPTEDAADSVAKQYFSDHKSGDLYANIETKPADESGMQLTVSKSMRVTYENVRAFEGEFEIRVGAHAGHVEGWGVLQESPS